MINATGPAPYVPAQPTPIPRANDAAGAAKAAQEFEAFVVGEFVEAMFQGVGEDALFGGGAGGEMFRSLLNREYAAEIAKSGGLGIADSVTAELLRAQENAR